MNELSGKILNNHASYLCLLNDQQKNIDGYDFQIVFSFYDEDFDIPSFLGVANGKNCTYEQFKQMQIKQKIDELKSLKEKIIKDEFFIHNDEIFPTYFVLENNLKKYRRRKLGNPDVMKFINYQKEHPEVNSMDRHYDIKYFGQFVDIYPDEIVNNVVMKSKFIEIEADATIARRKEVNEYIMNIKLDPFQVNKSLKYYLFDDIENDYNYTKNKLIENFKKYSQIYLFNVSLDMEEKLFNRLNFEIEDVSLSNFNLDTFINMKSNTLYRFKVQ